MDESITQTKEMSSDTYLSLSDEMKIDMNCRQFHLPESRTEEIETWLRTGTNYPYFIEQHEEENQSWVLFINEEDAVAFKLRWS